MIYFKITYLNAITGVRATYMNCVFTSYKKAKNELDCIQRNEAEVKDRYTPDVVLNCIKNNIYIPSFVIGSDWKIEPINIKTKLDHEI